MLFNRFINRHQELRELDDFLRSGRRRSKIAVITGRSGVGKSELTDEVVRRSGIVLFIRVSFPVPPCEKTVKDGVFLRNLSERVHQSAPRHGLPTMEQFANRVGTPALTEDYHRRLLEDGRRITAVAGFHALLQIFRRTRRRFYTAAELYRHGATWQPLIHRDYILQALRNEEALLVLENFQLIDHESLLHIHDLIRNLPRVSWIIEYTAPEIGDAQLRAFEEFRELCPSPAKLLSLPPVPLSDIISAAPESRQSETEVFQEQYGAHGGNLRVLLDTTMLFRNGGATETLQAERPAGAKIDATVLLLETLAPGPLLLLAVVLANDARVETAIAEAIFAQRAPAMGLSDYQTALEVLKAAAILTERDGFLTVGHDHVGTAFSNGSSRELTLSLALSFSADYYEECLHRPRYPFLAIRELTIRLVKIYLQTKQPLMILAHFAELRRAVLGSASREEALRFLTATMAILQAEEGVSEMAWWKFAHLCYEANLFDLAMAATEGHITSVRWHLLRALSLHNLDYNEEALSEAKQAFNKASVPGAKVAALLVQMVCHRAEARFAEAEQRAAIIEGDPSFRNEPEYAYFLRNLESIRDPRTSLSLAQESIRLLQEHGLLEQENKARITLAMQLARTGRTGEALAELRLIEKVEGLPISDRHMVWNNRCATEMLQGGWGEEEEFLLRRAQLICALDFDRIVISNNLALWHAQRGDIGSAGRQFAQISSLVDSENDSRIRCAVFFNQAELARRASDKAGEVEWLNKLRAEIKQVDDAYRNYWEARSAGSSDVPEQFRFLLSRPFHYLFLAHWSFPIRSDIEG